jgi:biopolymer transport protein ExbD
MKFEKSRRGLPSAEPDMTPMIDMTFQLIAFFMFVLNFGEGQQDLSIRLPTSELARPPERATENLIVLQLTRQNTVLFNGEERQVADLTRPLAQERELLVKRKKTPADASVFIRADREAKTGVVQELIAKCQEQQFEVFRLRANAEQR